jgi:hypothetical protein
MGRRMFSGGEGPWEADPRADGWWGASVIEGAGITHLKLRVRR